MAMVDVDSSSKFSPNSQSKSNGHDDSTINTVTVIIIYYMHGLELLAMYSEGANVQVLAPVEFAC